MSTKQTQDDELLIILANYVDDLATLKRRNGLLPAQAALKALKALKAREEAIAVRARIDELRICLSVVPMFRLSYERVENRIAELTQPAGQAEEE